MVVRRADLRTFPTRLRVFNDPTMTPTSTASRRARCSPARRSPSRTRAATASGRLSSARDTRPGSRSRTSPRARRTRYSGMCARTPYLVVTGATANTVFTPERPEVSELQLDMGERMPVLTDWPADKPVNGQHPYAAHVIELPVRAKRWLAAFHAGAAAEDGRCRGGLPAAEPRERAAPELQVPRRALWLGALVQRARLQRFRRRRCIAALACKLPRNTRDQGVSPAFEPHRVHRRRRS